MALEEHPAAPGDQQGGFAPNFRGGRQSYKERKVRHIRPERLAGASNYGRADSGAASDRGPLASGAAAQPAAPKDRPAGAGTRFATFMFKGGVYKTMTTILAASALAGPPFKKRVLIVDADSQCNATSFFQPEPNEWQAEHEQEASKSCKTSPAKEGGNALPPTSTPDDEVDGSGAQAGTSRISLSERDVACERVDPLSQSYFKKDTWLLNDSGEKFTTIVDVLMPEFDQGRGGMQDPKVIPVTHFQKKDLEKGKVVCQSCCKAVPLEELDEAPPRISDWFCSPECEDLRMSQHTLFLLPGSTKLSSLETRMVRIFFSLFLFLPSLPLSPSSHTHTQKRDKEKQFDMPERACVGMVR